MSQVAEIKMGLAQILVLYPVTLRPFSLSHGLSQRDWAGSDFSTPQPILFKYLCKICFKERLRHK